jgi:triosephosphate isomerase
MKPIIVANWKANKSLAEVSSWVEASKDKLNSLTNTQVVVCGPYTALSALNNLLTETSLKVGAQNVSHFSSGAYTGEITAEMLEGLAEYCIVGHSERKKYFGESEEIIVQKVERLLSKNIIPVLCIADIKQLETYLRLGQAIQNQAEKIIFVYEPPGAISGGGAYKPETPETAEQVCKEIITKIGNPVVTIYGGSVNPDNISSFLGQPSIHGALPGQASLEPETFIKLVSAANTAVV